MTKLSVVIDRGPTASKPVSPTEGYLYYDTDEDRLERYSGSAWEVCEPSVGASTFLGLTDTPVSYSGQAGFLVAVNDVEDALEFIVIGSLSDIIAGSLSDLWPSDAEDITYTPAVDTDWDSDADPGDLDDALDQLAERVDDLEGAGGGGGGDSTHTDAHASRPAASNDGDLFLPSDGFALERDTGAAWVPWGPLFPLAAVPAIGTWTWDNQDSAAASTADGSLLMQKSAGGGGVSALYRAAPVSTPWTITVALLADVGTGASDGMGIGFRQSSDGKLHLFEASGNNLGFASRKWTDSTTYSADYTYVNNSWRWDLFYKLFWLRIFDDGSNRGFQFSPDGVVFRTWHSIGRTDFLTADQACAYVRFTGRSMMRIQSWEVG